MLLSVVPSAGRESGAVQKWLSPADPLSIHEWQEAQMRTAMALLAAAALAGCATAYQPVGLMGGYGDTRLAENVWEVSFSGNARTRPERAADFALLRSAEVAQENGYPYFVIVASQNEARRTLVTTPSTTTFSANAVATPMGATVQGSSMTTGGETYEMVKPSTRNTIVGLKEKPATFAYETKYVIASLRQRYGLDDPDNP